MLKANVRRHNRFVGLSLTSTYIVRRVAVTVVEAHHCFLAPDNNGKPVSSRGGQQDDIQFSFSPGFRRSFVKRRVEHSLRIHDELWSLVFDRCVKPNHDV